MNCSGYQKQNFNEVFLSYWRRKVPEKNKSYQVYYSGEVADRYENRDKELIIFKCITSISCHHEIKKQVPLPKELSQKRRLKSRKFINYLIQFTTQTMNTNIFSTNEFTAY